MKIKKKKLVRHNKGVSQVISAILTLGLMAAFITGIMLMTSQVIDSRTTVAANLQAKNIANNIVDVLLDLAEVKEDMPNAIYTRTFQIPYSQLLYHHR